jgi:hypothetical protein
MLNLVARTAPQKSTQSASRVSILALPEWQASLCIRRLQMPGKPP